jgi:hypothetical protein
VQISLIAVEEVFGWVFEANIGTEEGNFAIVHVVRTIIEAIAH